MVAMTNRFGVMAVKASESGSRTLTFVGSTPTVDRVGDVVDPSGWDITSYQRNPVVLWSHNQMELPVGKTRRVYLDGASLKFDVEFAGSDIDPRAEQVYQCYRQGFLSAVSVCFKPIEERREGSINRVVRQELLELSCVTVPCNADALLSGKANIRPVFDERKKWDRMAGVDVERVKAFFAEPKGVVIMKAKADATAEAPAKPSLKGKLKELLTPKDGTISQESYDAAMKLIESMPDDMAYDDQEPDDQDPNKPEETAEPAPKWAQPILARLKSLDEFDALLNEADQIAGEQTDAGGVSDVDEPVDEEFDRALAFAQGLEGTE